MRIIVTGSKGFVGSKLVPGLKQNNHDVVELDISEGNDITDWDQLKSNSHFDCVIHLACLTYVPDSYEIPKDFYRVNILGTLNMLELCRLNNAKMIFASSYVYGVPDYLPIDENHPVKAFNPYAQSKLIGEQLCQGYHRDFNVPVIIFRPFNIYGKNQKEDFLIPSILKQASSGTVLLKDSRPKRDYIYIDDIVDAYIIAIERKLNDFEVYNLGTGQSHSIEIITELVQKYFKRKLNVLFTNEYRENEVLNTVADVSKAEKVLQWKPKVLLEEGIRRIILQES